MRTLLTLLLALPLSLLGQGEGNIWYFGTGSGLDFNVDPPAVISSGITDQWEGTATICDAAGNLLFYTDGLTVWNASHNIMPNGSGLLGGWSSTQSAIIVPQPDSSHIYYVFTAGQGVGSYAYSRVDMSEDGGLGDVVEKNVVLSTSATERLAAVKHGNGKDYWILTHPISTNVFEAYLLTNSGVSGPVSSAVGSTVTGFNFIGTLRFSHSGTQVANSLAFSGDIELFDFDPMTGVVSNALLLPYFGVAYGLEFSPDDSRLYCTSDTDLGVGQFDLHAGSPAAIAASGMLVNNSIQGKQLALAPDGKIYVADYSNDILSVIEQPDSLGFACDFNSLAVNMFPGVVNLGLPNYPADFFGPVREIVPDIACGEDTTFFVLTNADGADSVSWNFGDPASGIHNTALGNPVGHTYSSTGSFFVQAIYWLGGIPDSSSLEIFIPEAPLVFLGLDTVLCTTDPVLLAPIISGGAPIWQDGSTDSTLLVSTTGIYWAEVSNLCGLARDSVDIVFAEAPAVDLGADTVICPDGELLLDAGIAGASYLWSNGTTDQVTLISATGNYWVSVTDPFTGCSAEDSIVVSDGGFTVSLGADITVPSGTAVSLDAGPGETYLWSTGETSQLISAVSPGLYFVSVTNEFGCVDEDSIFVEWIFPNGLELTEIEVSVLPNPFTDFVELNIKSSGQWTIRVFAADGREILQKIHTEGVFRISTADFAAGFYVFRFESENARGSFKLQKVN